MFPLKFLHVQYYVLWLVITLKEEGRGECPSRPHLNAPLGYILYIESKIRAQLEE